MRNSSTRQRACLFLLVFLLVAGSGGPAEAEKPGPDGRPVADPLHAADLEKVNLASWLATKDGGEYGWAAVTSDRYDALEYILDLTVDPVTETITGSVQMRFASLVEGLDTVVMDLHSDLVVSSVLAHGVPVSVLHAADSLSIALPAPLASGQVDSVMIHYAGAPPTDDSNGLTFQQYSWDSGSGTVISSLSEPAYAQYWWPCKDRPDDKAQARIIVTAPDEFVAVSNGIQESVTSAAGLTTTTWQTLNPLATYLVSVAISDYVTIHDDTCPVTPLRNWFFPADEVRATEDLNRLCEMIEFMEDFAGPYPFADEKYGHAEFLWGGAMEHQTVTSYGAVFISGTHYADRIMVHELAHQWFGDSLSPRNWADIWLNEGFATYCEALWFEYEDGYDDGYLQYLNHIYHRDRNYWAYDGPVYNPVPVFPGRVIYDKGAWIVHMLRARMGDDAFFDFVVEYTTGGDRPYGDVNTAEFIELAEVYAGEQLDDFFDPWLNTAAHPVIGNSWVVLDGPRGEATHLRLTLSQTQDVIFDNIFPVLVHTDAGDTTVHVPLRAPFITLDLEMPGRISGLEVDPKTSVLWEAGPSPAPGGRIVHVAPNPVQESHVEFRLDLTGASRVSLKIYDMRGQLKHQVPTVNLVPEEDGSYFYWNCRDMDGRRVSSGVYWVDVEIGSERSVGKFTVMN